MTARAERRAMQPKADTPRIRLNCDERSGWILSEPGRPARQFLDFESARDSIRGARPSPNTTIEIWQDGEYVCCLPQEEWRPRDAEITNLHGPRFAAIDRYANRAAAFLLPAVGLTFWLALVVIAVTASFGWKLTLHWSS